MAFAHVAPPASHPTAPQRTRIFVSYSHDDLEEFGRPFFKALQVMLTGHREALGFDPDQVFFDRKGIRAGHDWDDTIEQALRESRVFLFLLSVNSLSSRYCLDKELRHAFQAGDAFPKIIVYLDPCDGWDQYQAPGDPKGRSLGAFEAVPRLDTGREDLQPISKWELRSEAWAKTMEAIRLALTGQEPRKAPPSESSRATSPRPFPPLIPYLCNQQETLDDLTLGLRAWKTPGKALAILLEGTAEDQLPKFCDRLCEMELKSFSRSVGRSVRTDRPLVLPSTPTGWFRRGEPTEAVLAALSEALTGDRWTLDSLEKFTAHLPGLTETQPLVVSLSSAPTKEWIRLLGCLFSLLEKCPAEVPLDRLAFLFLLESADPDVARVVAKGLAKLKLTRTVVVDTERLRPVTGDDIRHWYRNWDLDQHLPEDELTVARKVLKTDSAVRFQGFVDRLKSELSLHF